MLARAFDAAVFIFLPQLMMLLIRVLQRRPLLHRMTARTVVIGDIPWVAQCVEAFLSKLVACSYSATSLTVFSANPADHLVHRMTHRVVRGTLLACGRPDGRLMALTSGEQSVCVAVNRESSIRSMGETCESLTIGHNPYKLPLTAHHICLKDSRPKYLCEHLLDREEGTGETGEPKKNRRNGKSAAALIGSFAQLSDKESQHSQHLWDRMMEQKKAEEEKRRARLEIDCAVSFLKANEDGNVVFTEFEKGFASVGPKDLTITRKELKAVFDRFDADCDGALTRRDCRSIYAADSVTLLSYAKARLTGSTDSFFEQCWSIPESVEDVFGDHILSHSSSPEQAFKLAKTQKLSMLLYEGRIASLQRAVAFFVMFHEMGKCISDFWPSVSFGLLRYRMDRTVVNSIKAWSCPTVK